MPDSKKSSRNTVQRAFRRFVELVEPIPQVRHAVAYPDHDGDIFMLIELQDRDASKAVFHSDYQVIDEFPELESEFHILHMNGGPLEDIIHRLPDLVFSRKVDDANG